MTRRREPKTIEEVAEFLEGVLPVGWSMHVSVDFHARHDEGRRSSSRRYSVRFHPLGQFTHDAGFEVRGASPADLCKLTLLRIGVQQGLRPIAARRPRRELTTREFLHLDPPRQITLKGGAS